jgi:hypothetical protein
MSDEELDEFVAELTADLPTNDPIIGEVRTLLRVLRDLDNVGELSGAH